MEEQKLPPLREELALLPGPTLADGQPSWTLHDPVRNLFFQIDWPGFEVLSRWSQGCPAALVKEINLDTTLHLSPEDIEAMLQFLHQNQLLQAQIGSAGLYAELLKKRKGSVYQQLLHNYLFFRIPLVRPDRWLERWQYLLDFFYTRHFLQLTLASALLGIIGVYREWEKFSVTLVDLLTWNGLLAYGLTLTGVKVLHELGHGFTAKRFGCRVPTMGVAFLVLWPVAYTDTNEVWKLTSRRQRLMVAGAGIATEFAIAAWATLAWVWLPEGIPKSVAFLLSSTTWISTLLINASPFMRFDGYFLLSDYLRLPNLHSRSFALARWDLRERLFDLKEPPPEHFPPLRQQGLIIFAWAVWIYRLVIFLGIAILVYQFFIKAVGIFLFLVEIVWFVAYPAWTELREWKIRWHILSKRPRSHRSGLLAALVLTLFVIPWPSRIETSALLTPTQSQAIHAPSHAQVIRLPMQNAQTIPAETPLFVLGSPIIDMRTAQSNAKTEKIAWQSAAAGFDSEARRDWLVLGEQLASAYAEQQTVKTDALRYIPIALHSGTLRDLDPDLQPGQWLKERELLGHLLPGEEAEHWQIVAYIDEDNIHRVRLGDSGLFMADGGNGPDLPVEVSSLDKDTSHTLRESELAAPFGGQITIREKNGLLYPERAIFRVVLKIKKNMINTQHAWRGRLVIASEWEAPGIRFARTALTVFFREAGF